MNRLGSRALAVIGAGAFAVALAVGGAGSAVAAPTSGPIESMQDLKGAWLTSLTGFSQGDPISWLHRLTVRKVKGSAAVAWEEWLDCAVQATDCRAARAGKQTGVDWSKPSRVLMAMDPKGVVHGVGATGSIMLTADGDGLSAVMMSSGQRDSATANPTTSGQSLTARTDGQFTYTPTSQYAATGPSCECPSDGNPGSCVT